MWNRSTKRLVQLSIAALFAGYGVSASASGFQLFEANGAGVGDFYASSAAGAQDASTAYFNPAGLMYIPYPQVVVSAVNIFYNSKFTGSDKWANPSVTASTYTKTGTAQGGAYGVAPGFDVALPINTSMAFGFAVAAPFGLRTTWDDDAFTNYAATQSSVQVLDYTPNLAFKFTNALSFGVGLDVEHLDADFNGVSGLPITAQSLGYNAAAFNTRSKNDASGWGYGWHTGAMYQFTPNTRVGIDYHSKVSFTVNGTSKFEGPLAGGVATLANPNYAAKFRNNNLTADTTLPAWTDLGIYHQFNPQWAMAATATYTEWSVFDNITLRNVAAVNSSLQPQAITINVPEHFRNTWRFALGGSYQPCDQWLVRAGVGYDQNPTNSIDRNVRLPDGNRVAAALGAHYQATKALGVDVGYTHLWMQNTAVNTTSVSGSQRATVIGKAESSANLVGLQLTWSFV